MASRVLLFVQTGDARPKCVSGIIESEPFEGPPSWDGASGGYRSRELSPGFHVRPYMSRRAHAADRWRSLFVPYAELSEDMKEHDRKWARKASAVIASRLLGEPAPAERKEGDEG